MIPTNPMSPLTETAAAVPSVAAITTVSLSLATFTPRVPASDSPNPQHVEQSPVGEQHGRGDQHVRQDQPDLAPGRPGQAAEYPRVDRLERLGGLLLQIGLRGCQHRCGGDA